MRKALKWVLIGLVCATVLSAAGLAGLQYYNDNYVNISGVSYPKDTQFLMNSSHGLRSCGSWICAALG